MSANLFTAWALLLCGSTMLISWVSDSPCSTVLFGVVAFFLSEQNSAQYVCYGKIMLYLPKLKQN